MQNDEFNSQNNFNVPSNNQINNVTPQMFNNQFTVPSQPNNMVNNMTNNNIDEELYKMVQNSNQQFINNEMTLKDTTLTFTSEEKYNNNNLNNNSPYNNPENIKLEKKKATISINGEAKVFILIIALIFIFIIFLPSIFDLINNIKYR